MAIKVKNIILSLLCLFFAVTIWEHVATESAYVYKPTYFIDELTVHARSMFRKIGEWIGIVCSFLEYIKQLLEYIKLVKYFEGIFRICASVCNFMTSWMWVFVGYVSYVVELAKDSFVLTIAGTIIVATLVILLFYKYIWTNPNLKTVQRLKKWMIEVLSPFLGLVSVFALVVLAAYFRI